MPKFIIIPGLLILLAGFFQPASAGLSWTMSPDAYVQQQYVDNIFQARDNRESDWITVVGAGLQLQGIGRGEGVILSYRPSYSMYHRFDEYDTLRHNADLELWKYLKKHLRLSFTNSFERTEQPYDPLDDRDILIDPRLFDEEDLRRGREPRTTNNARARLDYSFGPRDTAYLQYSMRNEWNDNPGEEDSVLHNPSAGITYWLSRLYGMEASTSYTHGRYDESENRDVWDGRIRLMRNFTRFLDGYIQYRHSHVRYSGSRAGYSVYNPSAGISYRFARDGSMSLGLGYTFRDREGRSSDDSFVLDASINKTWSRKRSSFTLRGNSGYTESFLGDANEGFTVYYRGLAVYSFALRKNLDWNLSAGYRRNIYKDRDPERRDNIYSAGTGLNYRWTRHVSVGLNYDYRKVDSNIRAEEYYENRGTLTLNWRPQPKRL